MSGVDRVRDLGESASKNLSSTFCVVPDRHEKYTTFVPARPARPSSARQRARVRAADRSRRAAKYEARALSPAAHWIVAADGELLPRSRPLPSSREQIPVQILQPRIHS